MATESISIIDVDAGGGHDYVDLDSWNTGEQKNLPDANEIAVADCRNTSGGSDSTVTINGWTTDSTRYIKIWTNTAQTYRHQGVWDTDYFNIDETSSPAILIYEDYTQVIGMQFRSTADIAIEFDSTCDYCLIDTCVIYDSLWGIYIQTSSDGHTVQNSLFYDIDRAPIGLASTTAALMVTCYNCTGHNYNTADYADAGWARHKANGQVKVVNCIGFASAASSEDDFDTDGGTWAAGSDYNLSGDTSAPGGNSLHSQTDSAIFNNVGADDFTLKSGCNAIDAGVGPASDASVPTLDFEGDSRSGTTCDIGFDEYVGVGGGLDIPIAMYHYMHH